MTVVPANSSQPGSAAPRPARSAKKWVWLFVVLCLGFGAWYGVDHFGQWKDRFVPRRLRTVDPGLLYASGQIDRHLIRDVLVENKIRVIIVLLGNDPGQDVEEELAVRKELEIERYNYYLSGDGTGDIAQYA